jgi:hypothetical protein
VILGFIIRYLPIFLGALRLASLLGVSSGLALLIDFYTFYSFFIKCSFTFINFILTQQNEAFTVMRYIFTAQRYNHQESVSQPSSSAAPGAAIPSAHPLRCLVLLLHDHDALFNHGGLLGRRPHHLRYVPNHHGRTGLIRYASKPCSLSSIICLSAAC